MTRISLGVSGGFAATVRRPDVVLDVATLSPPDREALEALLARARAEPGPAVARRPDAMSYVITVEDASGATTLRRADGAMTPAFSDLLAWLRKHGG